MMNRKSNLTKVFAAGLLGAAFITGAASAAAANETGHVSRNLGGQSVSLADGWGSTDVITEGHSLGGQRGSYASSGDSFSLARPLRGISPG